MKNKLFFTAVFLLGCATPKIIEYVSFEEAIAKTGSKCHYVAEASYHSEVGYVKDGKINIGYSKNIGSLINNGWRLSEAVTSKQGQIIRYWEKCK